MSRTQRGWVTRGIGAGGIGRHAMRRMGWKDCVDEVAQGGQVVVNPKGHGELWDSQSYCIGFLTKRTIQLFNANRS